MKSDFHPSPTIWILHFVLVTKMYFIYRLKSYISTPLIRKGSHAENKASQRFFSNVLNSVVFYYTWFRKPNFCVQAISKQYLDVWFFVGRGACAEAKIWGKKLHKALRSIQFLASFASF